MPADGYGEASFVVHGTRRKLSARSEVPLPSGTRVYVLDVLSDTSVLVAPADPTLSLRGPAMTTALIALAAAAALVVLAVLAVITRIKVAGPNEAFIITGRKGRPVTNPETGVVSTDLSGQKIVMGSSVFVLPFVQKLSALDLSSRRLNVAIRGAVSSTGIKLDLEGVAIVKIAGSEDAIRAAGQRFRDAPRRHDRAVARRRRSPARCAASSGASRSRRSSRTGRRSPAPSPRRPRAR